MTHEFLSIYPAKLMEYGLAVLYLLFFLPFWSYVQGGRRTVARAATARPAVRSAPAVESPAGRRLAHGAHRAAARARRRPALHAPRSHRLRASVRRMDER